MSEEISITNEDVFNFITKSISWHPGNEFPDKDDKYQEYIGIIEQYTHNKENNTNHKYYILGSIDVVFDGHFHGDRFWLYQGDHRNIIAWTYSDSIIANSYFLNIENDIKQSKLDSINQLKELNISKNLEILNKDKSIFLNTNDQLEKTDNFDESQVI